MQHNIPHKRKALCAAISMSLLPLSATTLAQEEQAVEEVVVTGSFIRRSEGFTSASSVTQLDAVDLERQGTLNIGEVIHNLSFVSGPASSPTNTIQGTDSRSTEIDLRGLGARSTLTLLDGKRLASENVNAMIPTIAIQRMDIVADGAAALYGNEAVAGVVNFVPYKSYDGLKVDTYAEQTADGAYDEHSMQMMWGGEIGDLDVVVAGQFRSNSRLGWDERDLLSNSGLTISSNGPGNWFRPERGEDGLYTGAEGNAVDPACAPASARTSYTKDQVANEYGNVLGTTCFFDFGDNRSFREPTDTTQFYANATWEVSEDLTLSFQGFRTRLAERTYSSTSNPGNSRIGELPPVRGEIPGNPFFALDANGNQLYGVDANGDGVPDRGMDDLNGDGLNDYIVSGTMNNGVPLREDVRARRLRPINKTNRLGGAPVGHSPDMDNLGDNVDHISRYSMQADFTVPFIDGWEGMASYTRNTQELMFMSNQNYDITEMIKGLNCDVVNDRESCYNPFFVTDVNNVTSKHVIDAIAARDNEWEMRDLDIIDIVLNGE
ncbi:MAG: TonB-dependent receptor plug domain-containing protein, partial [Gammaproteobacteria bacterium]|nr:TonB-dependent receptor plug domain-containing protein [Gammaproteobacteria bacterium]